VKTRKCNHCNKIFYKDKCSYQRFCSAVCSLFNRVDTLDSKKCWNWLMYVDQDGYAELTYKGEKIKGHRLAYEFKNGDIPKGKQINHRCNNRKCVNPNHVYAGSHKDNMHDRMIAGTLSGEKHGMAKLNEEQVKYILKVFKPYDKIFNGIALAKQFNVDSSLIYCIIKRKIWKNVQ